jgi:hypothetical protein
MTAVEDFTHTLREALAEVEAAGFVEAATEARRRCFSAYTTSSEWLGEVGCAVADLLRIHGPALSTAVKGKLKFCLSEVAKVWPKFRAV